MILCTVVCNRVTGWSIYFSLEILGKWEHVLLHYSLTGSVFAKVLQVLRLFLGRQLCIKRRETAGRWRGKTSESLKASCYTVGLSKWHSLSNSFPLTKEILRLCLSLLLSLSFLLSTLVSRQTQWHSPNIPKKTNKIILYLDYTGNVHTDIKFNIHFIPSMIISSSAEKILHFN